MDATWSTLDPSTTKILFNALAAKLDALSAELSRIASLDLMLEPKIKTMFLNAA